MTVAVQLKKDTPKSYEVQCCTCPQVIPWGQHVRIESRRPVVAINSLDQPCESTGPFCIECADRLMSLVRLGVWLMNPNHKPKTPGDRD